jgi:hypothetical protein
MIGTNDQGEAAVAKLRIALRAVGLVAALVPAGCSGLPGMPNQPSAGLAYGWYPPWTLDQSPQMIALRWYPDVTPRDTVDEAAQRHCGSWNKSAELVSDARDGSVELAEYHCR